MNDARDKPDQPARRAFLKKAGATLAFVGAAAAPAPPIEPTAAQDATPVAPAPAPAGAAAAPAGYQSLGLEEAATTEALVEHMWPADHLTASGVELGIATFIDRQLAGAFGRGDRLYSQGPFRKGKAQHGYQLPLAPEAWYKAGIAALNAYCRRAHGTAFDRLAAPAREAALQVVSSGKAKASSADIDLSDWFNGLVYPLFVQGAFADPMYGGNRGKAAWAMIGYPGLPAVYNRDIVTFRGQRHPRSNAPKSIQDLS